MHRLEQIVAERKRGNLEHNLLESTPKQIDISVVVPAYNEEENVVISHQKIVEVLKNTPYTFEVIFIDDGSTDNTLENLKKCHPIRIISLRINRGQTAALDAGIKYSRGKIIVTMDSDLQNDPEDIPLLIAKLDEGFDLVSGWRKNRKDSFMKKFISRGAKFLRSVFVKDNIHDSGCTLKAYRRECFETLDLSGEMHRFIPALLRWRGFKVGEIEVRHHPRIHGSTKYNFKRTIVGLIDMLNIWFWRKYMHRPLHLFGAAGLLFLAIGTGLGLFALYLKIFYEASLSDTALTILSVFFFLTGLQLFVAGLLADIMSKNYYAVSKDQTYFVKEIIENENN